MKEEKKKWNTKAILKEGVVVLMILGMFTGGYYLYRFAQSNKEKERMINLDFYSGCNNYLDSIKRIQEVCPECITVDYDKLTNKMKKDYINKKNLEGKIE